MQFQFASFASSREKIRISSAEDRANESGRSRAKPLRARRKESANYLRREGPHWGFPTFNAFFHREYQLERYRPLGGPGHDKVIVSANDGTVYRVARKVKLCDTFWSKGQECALVDMLDGSPYAESFIGGDALQSFLAGSDYHRWHAPPAAR